jgi:hypothetical protein
MNMKTAGVAIDRWKLPIFKKHLDAAGCSNLNCPIHSQCRRSVTVSAWASFRNVLMFVPQRHKNGDVTCASFREIKNTKVVKA